MSVEECFAKYRELNKLKADLNWFDHRAAQMDREGREDIADFYRQLMAHVTAKIYDLGGLCE